MLSPAVFLTYPVPKIVMLPIFMIWFGIGDLSKVLIIALACFYPVFINAYYGVRQTRTILVWSALNMGATPAQIFRRVVLPSAAPMIFAGLRVSLALSFIVMFAAEMINARSGLGHMIRIAENSLRFDLMYVSLVTIAILGYAGDRLVRFAHSRLLAWQQPARDSSDDFCPSSWWVQHSSTWEAAARSGLWSPLLFPSLAKIFSELALFFTKTEMLLRDPGVPRARARRLRARRGGRHPARHR